MRVRVRARARVRVRVRVRVRKRAPAQQSVECSALYARQRLVTDRVRVRIWVRASLN